jgi:hypothetical protein
MIKLDHSKLLGFKLEQATAASAKVGGKPPPVKPGPARAGAKVGNKVGIKPPPLV